MIVTSEFYTPDGRKLIVTESNRGMMIRQDQTGTLYDKAIDIPNRYIYTETDIPIDTVE